jgi:hypothetical protein
MLSLVEPSHLVGLAGCKKSFRSLLPLFLRRSVALHVSLGLETGIQSRAVRDAEPIRAKVSSKNYRFMRGGAQTIGAKAPAAEQAGLALRSRLR